MESFSLSPRNKMLSDMAFKCLVCQTSPSIFTTKTKINERGICAHRLQPVAHNSAFNSFDKCLTSNMPPF